MADVAAGEVSCVSHVRQPALCTVLQAEPRGELPWEVGRTGVRGFRGVLA